MHSCAFDRLICVFHGCLCLTCVIEIREVYIHGKKICIRDTRIEKHNLRGSKN